MQSKPRSQTLSQTCRHFAFPLQRDIFIYAIAYQCCLSLIGTGKKKKDPKLIVTEFCTILILHYSVMCGHMLKKKAYKKDGKRWWCKKVSSCFSPVFKKYIAAMLQMDIFTTDKKELVFILGFFWLVGWGFFAIHFTTAYCFRINCSITLRHLHQNLWKFLAQADRRGPFPQSRLG